MTGVLDDEGKTVGYSASKRKPAWLSFLGTCEDKNGVQGKNLRILSVSKGKPARLSLWDTSEVSGAG